MRPGNMVWVIAVGATVASLSGASTALAQPQPAGAKAAAAPAGAKPGRSMVDVYKEAVAAFKAGNFQKAYDGFIEVWAQEKKPKVAGNLGRAELKLKKYCDAAEHLGLFLRDQPDLSPADRKDYIALLDEAKGKVATLRLEVDQPGAEILVDGASVGKAPLGRDLCVEPGNHKIEARLGEFKAAGEQDVAAGATATKKLEFAPPKSGERGGKPGGGVAEGGKEKPFPTRTVVLVSGAALAFVVGGVLTGLGVGQKSEALSIIAKDGQDPPCAQPGSGEPDRPGTEATCDKVRSLAGNADTLVGAGSGFLIAGGAVAASAAVSWLWPTSSKTSGAAGSRVAPLASADGVGLLWYGSF